MRSQQRANGEFSFKTIELTENKVASHEILQSEIIADKKKILKKFTKDYANIINSEHAK